MSDPGAAPREARIGVYGGTFNPIHRGHLRSAEQVVSSLGLERVLFIPSARPPHKADDRQECIAPGALRLAWVELAVADDPRFVADAIEIDRGGASYSVDTLEALVARFAPKRIVFIIGHDAFVEMGTWREPERIFAMVDIAVTTRPPVDAGDLREWLPECVAENIEIAPDGRTGRHRMTNTRLELVEIDALDVSASEIRARLRKGSSVIELLPAKVAAAVDASRCYTARENPVPDGVGEERTT